MINEEACKISVMSCKNYIPGFDIMYIDDTGELRFAKYRSDYPVCRDDNNTYRMAVKDNDMKFDYITRNRALCYYDIDHHRWCTKISNYRVIYWQVLIPSDELFIDMLAGIATDELYGSKTCLSMDDITSRIKSRFMIWYDNRYKNVAMHGSWTNAIKVPDNFFFDEKACSELKKSLEYTKYPVYKRPQPKLLQFNGDYTTVVWEDGSHTVVKRCTDEKPDDEKAVLFAIVKHLCKDNGCEMDRYLRKFFENGKILHKEDKNDKKDNSEDNN